MLLFTGQVNEKVSEQQRKEEKSWGGLVLPPEAGCREVSPRPRFLSCSQARHSETNEKTHT